MKNLGPEELQRFKDMLAELNDLIAARERGEDTQAAFEGFMSRPLSVVVWSLISSASYGRASAVAVMMLHLMLPILAVYWMVARRAVLRF